MARRVRAGGPLDTPLRHLKSPDREEPTRLGDFADWRVEHATRQFKERLDVIFTTNAHSMGSMGGMHLDSSGLLLTRDALSNYNFQPLAPALKGEDGEAFFRSLGLLYPSESMRVDFNGPEDLRRFDLPTAMFSQTPEEGFCARVDFGHVVYSGGEWSFINNSGRSELTPATFVRIPR